jgi:AGCS family alanine or glycine:cation symporter
MIDKKKLPTIFLGIFFAVLVLFISNIDFTGKDVFDTIFKEINGVLATFLFYDLSFGLVKGATFPFIVAWLIVAGVFFTIRFNFVNLRMMPHSLKVLMGKYRTKDDKGEVSPFASLTTALSATVGLGNIAGVAIAISVGGPGATFWMIMAGFLGMTLKFTEVTLSQQYRVWRPDGRIMGGAMEYLSRGLAEKGMGGLGKTLAIIFAIFTIGGSLGAGNAFQLGQSMGAMAELIPFIKQYPIVYGIAMATLVGFVIIGGIKRIANTAEAVVPTMVLIYLSATIFILLSNFDKIPHAISLIFTQAFNPTAVTGGIIGVLVQGFKRAVFSSEAGIGSAAIVHATASVKYPVRQGFVALYEPFIDTIVICTMTALVIVITGVYDPNGEFANLVASKNGAALTSAAFGTVLSWFPIILTISVTLFAFSTMISWSYYGERAWTYVFGERYTLVYRLIFIGFTVVASIVSLGNMLDFSDLLILGMAFPNLIGLYILNGNVKRDLDEYMQKLKSGELDREILKN